jgi:hypothetical protein
MFKIHRMHKMPFPQPLETYREFLNSRLCEKRSNYLRMIDDWMSVFGRDQVVLLYYDDILERPRELLQRLCEALSLDFDISYFGDRLQRRVNATSRFQPPAAKAGQRDQQVPAAGRAQSRAGEEASGLAAGNGAPFRGPRSPLAC